MQRSTINAGLTLGQIADRLGIAQHRLKYALQRHKILPAGRVGIIRLWDEADLPRIKQAITEIAANRGITRPEDLR